MIFHEPMTPLNPVMTIGKRITGCSACTRDGRRSRPSRRRRQKMLFIQPKPPRHASVVAGRADAEPPGCAARSGHCKATAAPAHPAARLLVPHTPSPAETRCRAPTLREGTPGHGVPCHLPACRPALRARGWSFAAIVPPVQITFSTAGLSPPRFALPERGCRARRPSKHGLSVDVGELGEVDPFADTSDHFVWVEIDAYRVLVALRAVRHPLAALARGIEIVEQQFDLV